MNNVAVRLRTRVPMARRRRKPDGLSPKARFARVVQMKALKPKAANGKADAVPRCKGQLNVEVLIAAEKAVQLPVPVRKDRKLRVATLIDPGPLSYAVCMGK